MLNLLLAYTAAWKRHLAKSISETHKEFPICCQGIVTASKLSHQGTEISHKTEPYNSYRQSYFCSLGAVSTD